MNGPPADIPRLLIVDDSPLDQAIYRRSLRHFALQFASTGEEGLERAAAARFDLVILDYNLPGIDGGQVLDAIRGRLGLGLPIVVVTGGGNETLAADLLLRGASDYVTKEDLATPRLASAVTGALERHRSATDRARVEADLRARRDELEATVLQLRDAQAHLIQSEKMASLGQLVAGVAHEINNPIAFVTNNLSVLERDVGHLAGLVHLYRDQLGETIAAETLAAEERIDLSYTLANLDRLFRSSQRGLKRVREIVGSLRDFARLDEADRKDVDPNDVVRHTLEIARYALHEKEIELVVDLAELPRLWCSPGNLNQALLNIILNAAQAIPRQARIDVRSRFVTTEGKGEIRLEVADNGPGVSESIQARIFDPFFTTKPQGVGTGLGLWVSYNIVREHGGRIELESESGRGATFAIVLPVGLPETSPST